MPLRLSSKALDMELANRARPALSARYLRHTTLYLRSFCKAFPTADGLIPPSAALPDRFAVRHVK